MLFEVLPKEFVESYKDKVVPFGPLGYVVYKRTYARALPDGATEEWYQTIERVVNGNISLEMNHRGITVPEPWLVNEAKEMYDYMFNLKVLPGGRGLWASGTQIQEKHGGALTNCYYINVEPYKNDPTYPFCFAMDMLMVGAGVGYGVSQEFVDKLPIVKEKFDIKFVCDEAHADYEQLKDLITLDPVCKLDASPIEDTREDWVLALGSVISDHYALSGWPVYSFDVSKIRPYGAEIKGFGGKASGPKPLMEMLRDINKIFNNAVGRKLTSVECMDIMCLIGRCVVAGNVRRSAEIALGDVTDIEFVTAKTWGQSEDKNLLIANHRWASNNSVVVSKPDDIDAFVDALLHNGEPGFFNREMHQNYGRLVDGPSLVKDNATGTNPCGEISLESGECCNLADIILPNCNKAELFRAVKIAVNYTKRVTLAPYTWKITKDVVARNRRLGVGVTGVVDFIQKNPPSDYFHPLADSFEPYDDDSLGLYDAAEIFDYDISKRLAIPPSVKLTTVKPSGTLSLLAGCSPGVHYPVFEYYIRRIQFSNIDPLVPYLQKLGFESYVPERLPNVVIVKFPMTANPDNNPDFKSERNVSFEDKLNVQTLLQHYWADNSVSCTLTFREDEHEDVKRLLKERFYELKSTSALPISDIEELMKSYPDLPYQPITKEEYTEMRSKIKVWPGEVKFSGNASDYLTDEGGECAGGSCPVR